MIVLSRLKRKRVAGLAVLGMVTTGGLIGVAAPSALANGVAGVSPSSGSSTTKFNVLLPSGAKCSGDTATKGYKVFSYVVPNSVNPLSLNYKSGAASSGAALIGQDGTPYELAATGVTSGVVLTPPEFSWQPYIGDFGSGKDLSAGTWQVGIACATVNGVLDVPGNGVSGQNGGYNLWNYQITFTAVGTQGNFSWKEVPLTITNPGLASSDINRTYIGTTLTAAGGRAPYTYAASPLPAGITINKTTGAITGTPTGPVGNTKVTLTVTDSLHATFSVVHTLPVGSDPAIATTSIPAATHGVAYSTTIKGTGGSTPYTWTSAALPAGLTINASTGVISGTPTTAGTYSPRIALHDKAGIITVHTYTLTVH